MSAFLLSISALHADRVEAQTWSGPPENPALWQIVAVDQSGEPGWPYGSEDVAGDGLSSFSDEEAETDLRSVYADADSERLWLRAYVAAQSEPPAAVYAFFFLNTDGRNGTGGAARGAELGVELPNDPTAGGYERAIGLRGNGSVLGAWEWDATTRRWQEIENRPAQAVRAEIGVARDPLRLGADDRGYVQTDVQHTISGLSASCGSAIFVRLYREGPAARTFVDDATEDFACRAPTDAYGDPVVLRAGGCSSDAACPADGRCREGICVFRYPCASDVDCRSGESCEGGACVRATGESCNSSADCDGLVCEAGRCAACSESGGRACGAGLVCSPNGACLDPDRFEPGAGADGPGKVQGGAFSCSASTRAERVPGAALALLLAALGWLRGTFGRRKTHEEQAVREARRP